MIQQASWSIDMGTCCSKNRDPGTAFKKDVKMPLLDDLPEGNLNDY